MKYLFLFICFSNILIAQTPPQHIDDEKPKGDLATPYDALFTFVYYMSPEHYQSKQITKIFPRNTIMSQELALQLKQVLDGKGLRIRLQFVPEDSLYVDSISRKNIYLLFPKELPEIYLERDKESEKWRFSRETIRAIPEWHQKVYPLGSDLLVQILPSFGQDKFLGLAVWQYVGILIVTAFAILLIWGISRLLRLLIQAIADSRLGKDGFDTALVLKVARILSYLFVMYLLYILIPVLQLPVGFAYYVIISLRIFTTLCIILLCLRLIELVRSYVKQMVKKEDGTDEETVTTKDHLISIVSRVSKIIVLIASFFHILGILDFNVTPLIAGLSIGGLALALAAQETVKNLIGSVMIYADRPFKIGDFINGEGIEGTVEDIGFRSTRIRTLDTSLVAVPNGKLIDMIVNNIGARVRRRFRTIINLPFHTPPALLDAFLSGLRQIAQYHPHIYKEEQYISLNSMQESSLGILFWIYISTDDFNYELQYREEVIFSILRLANTLGVQIAIPTSSVYVDKMPEKQTGIPDYQPFTEKSNVNLQAFMDDFRKRFPIAEENDEEDEDDHAIPSPS